MKTERVQDIINERKDDYSHVFNLSVFKEQFSQTWNDFKEVYIDMV